MDTIIIYGMRGTGKTTIGKEVAAKLGYIFIDLDQYISEKVGMKLSKYIDKFGWDIFRDTEHKFLKEILRVSGKKVLSLGGGTMVFNRNILLINKKKHKKSIFIETDINIIKDRILNDENNNNKRNSLTGEDVLYELETVYKKRKNIYKENADHIVNNNGCILDAITQTLNIINRAKICIPITDFSENYLSLTFEKLKHIRNIKYIELRIDFLDDLSRLENIIKKSPKKTIVTNRTKKEWGNFEGTFKESLYLLKKSLEYGADLVDIELQLLESIEDINIDFSKVIISFHDFDKTPELDKLKEILNKMDKYKPRVYKIAVKPDIIEDVDKVYKLTDYFKKHFTGKDFVFISMGELGKKTRIDIPNEGGLLTFASFDGNKSAPGQINYKKLITQVIV